MLVSETEWKQNTGLGIGWMVLDGVLEATVGV